MDDLDQSLEQARGLVTTLEEEPSINPDTGTREFALRDPDGYYVMLSALSAASQFIHADIASRRGSIKALGSTTGIFQTSTGD